MAKAKVVYYCRNCGAQAAKWIGKCPSCEEWNTFDEEVVQKESKRESLAEFSQDKSRNKPQKIAEISAHDTERLNSYNHEFNRVLGGGIVPGSLVLIGGEPGIGKSTLMLQIALKVQNKKVLYITGEESSQQIKMRAERIGSGNENTYILTETSTQQIFHHLETNKPDLLVIDSIQTLHSNILDSSPGSISQIRECTSELQRYSKLSRVPVFLIGHITKDGLLAGPKVLEHIVDVVLQFEGERNYGYRILRSVKNRFGSTSEIGIFEMNSEGLREVSNPSEILISQREEDVSGVCIAATIEGIRPILIETQALVSSAAYGTPQRSSTGFDLRRLNMLLAVLEKKCGFRLGAKDVFLNIAGGIRVDDPAIDLAVIAAVLSSSEDLSIDRKTVFAAEVGLSGEIRPVNRIEQRISEAEKLGYERIFISRFNAKGLNLKSIHIKVVMVSKIEEVFSMLFA